MPEPIHRSDLAVSDGATCSIDESCNSGCCDDHPAAPTDRPSRAGWKAAAFGGLCLIGCLAGPFLAAGLAASAGAVSGKVVIGLLVAVAIVAVAVVRRRGRPPC